MKIIFEKIVPAADSSFAILDKRAARFDGRYHFHPEVEVTLIEASTGRRVVGDSIEAFAPGDLVLLGGNLPHQYVSDPAPRRARGGGRDGARGSRTTARAKVIQFRADLLGDAYTRLPELKRIALMFNRATRGLKFGPDTTEQAAHVIRNLFAATGARQLLRLLELLDLLSCDGRATPIASAGYSSRISTREGDAIDRALAYLNERFIEPVSLENLARHLHVSPATCNRLLRKSIGRSFKTSLNEIRVSHACRMLLETDSPIVEVAYASGFNNLSNFNRRFKELKHQTPRAYRNLARQHA